jgi:rfaE bifunctional protein kinase chain/domain
LKTPTLSDDELKSLFDGFGYKKVLVIGDVMLDSYWWGSVERISPEAPVPVVNISRKEYRLGGAANVALNLKALGAQPILCSLIGKDLEAEIFLKKCEDAGISTDGIISGIRPTTVKTRVIGNKSQLLRIDAEEDKPLNANETAELWEIIAPLFDNADLVIMEDYDKGVITEGLIRMVIDKAKSKKIPVTVDPKRRNFLSYSGATLFKPNLRELSEGLKIDIDGNSSLQEISSAASELISKMNLKYSLITLSERGVFITNEVEGMNFPAHVRSIYDVSGAGDTVISVASLALVGGASMELIACLANLAGGLVCEKAGVVPIDKDDLYREAQKEFAA